MLSGGKKDVVAPRILFFQPVFDFVSELAPARFSLPRFPMFVSCAPDYDNYVVFCGDSYLWRPVAERYRLGLGFS
jgi:hypothetical protein